MLMICQEFPQQKNSVLLRTAHNQQVFLCLLTFILFHCEIHPKAMKSDCPGGEDFKKNS